MLFFVICACFALFPQQVLSGASNGVALCINTVIPSLLPFMLISACLIKSGFSKPLGGVLSKIISPLTGISAEASVCLVTGLLGGYGAGARAVYQSYSGQYITKKEAQHLLAFCNNAGPLFVIGAIGIGFYSDKFVGVMLYCVQAVTAIICAALFGKTTKREKSDIKEEWNNYKRNRPPLGRLASQCAAESGSAILTVCVYVITFSAILEVLPNEGILAGIVEVTRGCKELSKGGIESLPLISAILAWGGLSVCFQAEALCYGELDMKMYYIGRITACIISMSITYIICKDIYTSAFAAIIAAAVILCVYILKNVFKPVSQKL